MSSCGNDCPDGLGATEFDPTIELTGDVPPFKLDPWDLPAAILYLVFDFILAFVPVGVWYGYLKPATENPLYGNGMFKTSWYIMWIGNITIYGVPALLGGFAWLWNAFLTIGYVAWSQYLVFWGGILFQFLNFILMIIGASVYKTSLVSLGYGGPWIAFAVWFAITAGIKTGMWLLNDNFLAYWTIEEIIHGLNSYGETSMWRTKDIIGGSKEDPEPVLVEEEAAAEPETAAAETESSPFEEFDLEGETI